MSDDATQAEGGESKKRVNGTKRIVFVNRFFYPDHSATSQLVSDLAFKAAEWGYEVVVVTSRQRYDDPSVYLPVQEATNGVSVIRVGSRHYGRRGNFGRLMDYFSYVRGARRKLKELVNKSTIVVAKTDPPMLGAFLMSLVRRKSGVLVNWLQDVFPETLAAVAGSRLTAVLWRPLEKLRDRSLKEAAVNVVIGHGMQDYLLSRGIPREKLSVIHNWPYDTTMNASPGSRDFRRQWGISDAFVVGYFGNLGRAHEYETVLGAMSELSPEANIRFLFVGGGVLLEELKSRAAKRGLSNFLHRDYVPRVELLDALKCADVHLVILRPELERFVVPSKFSGVLAANRPVLYVGDPEGEIGRKVREERCGHVIRPGDGPDLADKIRTLAKARDTVASMGFSASRVYREQYRSETILEQWRDILHGL